MNYETVNVIGDGNCFFRAVLLAAQLRNLDPFSGQMVEEAHMRLRAWTVELAANTDKINFNDIRVNEYCADPDFNGANGRDIWVWEMSNPKTWAEGLAIACCAELLQVPIQVYTQGGRACGTYGAKYAFTHPHTGISNTLKLDLTDGHFSVII